VRASILGMVAHVTKNKLRGQYLHRRTGTLIRSITASPAFQSSEEVVRGTFGSNLDYARAHEEGFSGKVQVKAHLRKLAPRKLLKARRLASGEMILRAKDVRRNRRIARRSRFAHVRPHSRQVDIPAKHFLADTVADKTAETGANVRKAVLLLAETRRVPTLSQLRGRGALSLREQRAF
jgi:hypothetical protein